MRLGLRRPIACWAAVLAAGCAGGGGTENVLVVTLDTTRADRFGAYGYSAGHTPHFDRFGEQRAVRFDYALSAVPITLPSHSTIFTGTYPVFHGVRDNDDYRLDDAVTTLAEILGGAGFRTAAFVAAAPLLAVHNLDQGFEVYDDEFEADWTEAELLARGDLDFGFAERRSDQVNLAFERWLREHHAEPFFAWVHYFDPHQPHELHPPYDSLLAGSPYDAEMAYMDESFGELLALLESFDLLEETLVVIVGDHGEGLFQHDEPTHASFLYDSTQHVPLWIASPGHADRAGAGVPDMVRTVDVGPTILDLLGLPPGGEMQGRSLRPLLEGGELAPEPALMETWYNWFRFGWAPTRALHTGEWKVVEGPRPRLFHVAEDPGELRDLAAQEPERLADLLDRLGRLERRVDAGRPERSVAVAADPGLQRQLQALGYLGGGGGGADFRAVTFPPPEELAALPDPADHTLELLYANSAAEMIRVGNYGEAVKLARSGLAVDPGNVMLREHLARGLAGLRLLDEAMEVAAALVVERPESAGLLRLASRLHEARGEDREMVATLGRVAELGVADAEDLWRLARAYARLGEHRQAVDHYRAAAELDEPRADMLTDLANSLVELGDNEAAVAAYQEALDLAPESARTRFYAGQFYLAAGNAEFARTMFGEVLQLDPDHVGARVFLARMDLAAGAAPQEVAPMLREVLELSPGSVWARQASELLAGAGL